MPDQSTELGADDGALGVVPEASAAAREGADQRRRAQHHADRTSDGERAVAPAKRVGEDVHRDVAQPGESDEGGEVERSTWCASDRTDGVRGSVHIGLPLELGDETSRAIQYASWQGDGGQLVRPGDPDAGRALEDDDEPLRILDVRCGSDQVLGRAVTADDIERVAPLDDPAGVLVVAVLEQCSVSPADAVEGGRRIGPVADEPPERDGVRHIVLRGSDIPCSQVERLHRVWLQCTPGDGVEFDSCHPREGEGAPGAIDSRETCLGADLERELQGHRARRVLRIVEGRAREADLTSREPSFADALRRDVVPEADLEVPVLEAVGSCCRVEVPSAFSKASKDDEAALIETGAGADAVLGHRGVHAVRPSLGRSGTLTPARTARTSATAVEASSASSAASNVPRCSDDLVTPEFVVASTSSTSSTSGALRSPPATGPTTLADTAFAGRRRRGTDAPTFRRSETKPRAARRFMITL
ncbi:hypothetical protein QUG98_10025 [Curtobacterium sp. RHCJP20]|uniref:Uncharacterized protein n=1 Tax=Curtobacterium subtropicum TaxID=3055138 RepID=A0ABT7TGS0_9MICO|nr:hypothetical protein [Curtobacterium subtropicum]MDM7888789.1 hypothetical protein [Curtobacterium subtropicum]